MNTHKRIADVFQWVPRPQIQYPIPIPVIHPPGCCECDNDMANLLHLQRENPAASLQKSATTSSTNCKSFLIKDILGYCDSTETGENYTLHKKYFLFLDSICFLFQFKRILLILLRQYLFVKN